MPRTLAHLLTLVLVMTGLGATAGPARAAADGYLAGTITGPGGVPLADAWVNVYARVPGADLDHVQTLRTDPAGHYLAGPLDAGAYVLHVEDDQGRYVPRWRWDPVQVGAGQTVSGVDVRLEVGGSITGTVTNPAGNRVDNLWVSAWWWDPDASEWSHAGSALTAVGDYTLDELTPGRYRVGFEPDTLQPEFWRDASSLETARDVVVVAGQETTGIDASLAAGQTLFGTVTRAGDAAPLPGVDVLAHWWNPVAKRWDPRATGTTGADGTYLLRGLAPGDYRIELTPDTPYVGEFWPDAASLETATTVTVDDASVWDVDVELSTVPFPEVDNLTAPTVLGTPQVGQRLTASPGSWSPGTDLVLGYQWMVGDVPVTGATSATFAPPASAIGRTVRVEVSAALPGHTTGSATSSPSAAVIPAVVATSAPPTLSAVPRVGAAVSATTGTWEPADAVLSYQWLLDGQPVPGASGASYVPVPGDRGRALSVRVTGTKAPWDPSTATSAAATVGAGVLRAAARPQVIGKPRAKAVLRVSTGRWAPSPTKVTIQWYAGAKAIRKATTARLRLTGATLRQVRRKVISVRVSVAAPGYATVVTKLKVRGTVR